MHSDSSSSCCDRNAAKTSGCRCDRSKSPELTSSRRTARRAATSFLWNLRYGLNLRKPRRLARIARNYYRLYALGRQPCRTIDVSVTFDCNLTCEHCFSEAFRESQHRRGMKLLTLDQYATLAGQIDELGFFGVTFTGGEPTLRKDLFDIIRLFDPGSKFISIGTNGTLWDMDRLRQARKTGVDCLYVSIDSLDAATHDRFRGLPGTLEKAIWTIDHARKAGLQTAVNTTLTHEGLYGRDFADLIEWTQRRGVLLLLNLASPTGRWRHHEELYFTEADTKHLADVLLRHPHVRIDYEGNYRQWGCPAFKERFYVTATGEVIPCPFIHVSFGNFLQTPLKEIRRKGLEIPHFQEYRRLCPAAQDIPFIKQYLLPVQDQEFLPTDYRNVFGGGSCCEETGLELDAEPGDASTPELVAADA